MTAEFERCLRRFNGKQSTSEASRFVRVLVRGIGPGFHPDTEFRDYVSIAKPSRRIFSDAEAERLQAELDRARSIFEAVGRDICVVALPVQRRIINFARRSNKSLRTESRS